MIRTLFIMAAWAAAAAIAFVTLSPIGLRPETGSAGFERFFAYSLLGALFVAAYPRHFVRVMMLVLALAGALELLQHLTPDRHGHIVDALEKMAGGSAGSSLARLAQSLFGSRS